MKTELFSFRLPPRLAGKVTEQARLHGVNRTTWTSHLVERGLAADALDGMLEPRNGTDVFPAPESAGLPPEIVRRIVFAACFAEAILKKLNASLNRNSSELGIVASQARDQAQAETAAVIEALYGTPGK